MSRKKCRRKVWPTNINAVGHAIYGAALIDPGTTAELHRIEKSALEAFRTGEATIDDYRVICDMHNIAEILAGWKDGGWRGIGPEAMPACRKAQEFLQVCVQRQRAQGHFGVIEGAHEAFLEVWEFHDLQRASIPRSLYEKALERLAARMRSTPEALKVVL